MRRNDGFLKDAGKNILAAIVLWAIFYTLLVGVSVGWADSIEAEQQVYRVERAIALLVSPAPNRPLAQKQGLRLRLAADIVNAADQWAVPPLLLTTVAFRESSFRSDAVGTIGEKGITQIHGAAQRGCDLKTRKGQLSCGSKWLAKGFGICGSWEGALTAYACGECHSDNVKVRSTVNSRMSMWRKMEQLTLGGEQ